MEESVLRHYSTHYRENDCFLLWMEAKLQAARDPQFCVGFNACLRELREVVAEYVRQFSEHVGTPLPMAPENWRWASWPCPTACSSATLLIRRRSPTKSPRPCWRRSSAASSSANPRQNKHAARRSAGGRATAGGAQAGLRARAASHFPSLGRKERCMTSETRPSTINRPVFYTAAVFILLLVGFAIAVPRPPRRCSSRYRAGSWATPAGSISWWSPSSCCPSPFWR